jgi:hypothetical protein
MGMFVAVSMADILRDCLMLLSPELILGIFPIRFQLAFGELLDLILTQHRRGIVPTIGAVDPNPEEIRHFLAAPEIFYHFLGGHVFFLLLHLGVYTIP